MSKFRVSVYANGASAQPSATRYYATKKEAARYANAQRARKIVALVERVGAEPQRTNQYGSW